VANIKERYDSMTRTQKKVLDYMLANPESMCFITLRELSAETEVSEPTILTTCAALGYENFNELKYEFRKYISLLAKVMVQVENLYASPRVPARELSDKHNLLLQVCQEEFDMTKRFFASLDIDGIFKAAKMILPADSVIICGFGVSKQIATFFSMRLALLGVPSIIVDTESSDSVQAALPFLSERTVVVAISYPDYYLMTTKVAEYAKQKNAPVIALTDSAKSPVVKYSSLALTCQTTTRLFLNTIGLPMMLVNFITTAINIEKSASLSKVPSTPEEFASFFSQEDCQDATSDTFKRKTS
jgi:DNA-binding MurR/RpiR family transcriptional regulator